MEEAKSRPFEREARGYTSSLKDTPVKNNVQSSLQGRGQIGCTKGSCLGTEVWS